MDVQNGWPKWVAKMGGQNGWLKWVAKMGVQKVRKKVQKKVRKKVTNYKLQIVGGEGREGWRNVILMPKCSRRYSCFEIAHHFRLSS
jgi:hypothetical protein